MYVLWLVMFVVLWLVLVSRLPFRSVMITQLPFRSVMITQLTYRYGKINVMPFLSVIIARTSAIFASAQITELCSTLACHMIAAFSLFNPEFAAVTLLKVMSFNKCVELRVILIIFFSHLILVASQPSVEDGSARKAIVFVAHRAIIFFFAFEHESIFAVRCHTP